MFNDYIYKNIFRGVSFTSTNYRSEWYWYTAQSRIYICYRCVKEQQISMWKSKVGTHSVGITRSFVTITSLSSLCFVLSSTTIPLHAHTSACPYLCMPIPTHEVQSELTQKLQRINLLIQKKMSWGEYRLRQEENLLASIWKDSKPVTMLSTLADPVEHTLSWEGWKVNQYYLPSSSQNLLPVYGWCWQGRPA